MLATLNGRFLVAAFAVVVPLALLFYVMDGDYRTRPPSSPAEVRAVEIARKYLRRMPRLGDAAERGGRIRQVRGQWEVNFPSPRSVTLTGGPIITMDKTTYQVLGARVTD